MFERFLKDAKKQPTEETENSETQVPEQPANLSQNGSQSDSLPNDGPMSDVLNPAARPPMAPRPTQVEQLPSEEEFLSEDELAELENDTYDPEDLEEEPESQGAEETESDVPPPPAPPAFIKRATEQEETTAEEAEDAKEESNVVEPPKVVSVPISDRKEDSIQASLYSSGDKQRVLRGESLHSVDFADIWFTPEGVAYVRDVNTYFALMPIETNDLDDFHRALEQGFTGSSSYAITYAGDVYRVERVQTLTGLQYNCRKMPMATPEIETLGFSAPVVKHLTGLGASAGLLLFAGPTGQGKTTTASSLMKRYLDKNGGFLYTIEDPPEMPLSGVYHSANGGLGLCKQVPVENDQWGPALRSALRSRPRYILVGEIRTPETASQCLVAATSGHLVISTIHANGVEDALNSLIKYAVSSGLAEDLASDLLARGILGVVHQRLEGTSKLKLVYQSAFANPNAQAADQMRMAIRDKNINLATFMEQQKVKMDLGLPMFRE